MNGPDHKLNAPCPECACPQWIHNDQGCLTLKRPKTPPGDGNAAKVAPLKRCQCSKVGGDFQ